MQINGYRNAMPSATPAPDASQKTETPNRNGFTQMLQNTHLFAAGSAQQTADLSPEEEMEVFKKEIYWELAQINAMNSPSVLSNSVRITDDGFQRMKDDPEYRKEIMDWLRADARASYGLPGGVHVMTTITGHGATSSSIGDCAGGGLFGSQKDDSFYYAERKAKQRKRDAEWFQERHEREMLAKLRLKKQMAKKAQAKAIDPNGPDPTFNIAELLFGSMTAQGGVL